MSEVTGNDINERALALKIFNEIIKNNAYNNIALKKNLDENPKLSRVGKGFITELVNGTLRHLILIDYLIGNYTKSPLSSMDAEALNILRMGVYQIIKMDKVPESAACNESVKLIKLAGKAGLGGFVNGVLRNIIRGRDTIKYPTAAGGKSTYLQINYSYPRWICDLLIEQYGFEFAEALCGKMNVAPKVSICVNSLKGTADELAAAFEADGATVERSAISVNSLQIGRMQSIAASKLFKDGLFHVQDPSGMMAVEVLNPQPGEVIIDACAAPGGKSFYIAQRMNDLGTVYSRDIHAHKIKLMRQSLTRLGLRSIITELKDASKTDADSVGIADRLLIDAPCSGLGLIRKKPDIKLTKDNKQVRELVALQRRILGASYSYLKPGGYLVYSTCTFTRAENIENMEWFLDSYPFEPVDLSSYMALPDGIDAETAKNGYIELFPNTHDTDGFFIACMRKEL